MSKPIIEIKDLSFEYPGKRALDSINLSIKEGTVTALVGPNGAGKTTLIRCIAALETPFSGSIKVDGIDTGKDPRKCHELMGYLPDFFGLYENLTVRQTIEFFLKSNGVDQESLEAKILNAIKRVELEDKTNAKASELSRGMRQRLAIAIAIAHNPKIIILDEPASGLDPDARKSLSSLFLKLNKEGATLIVSSHILTELEDYCNEMIIISDGKVKVHKEYEAQEKTIFEVDIKITNTNEEELSKFIEKVENAKILSINLKDNIVFCKLSFNKNNISQTKLLKDLINHGFEVLEFASAKETLSEFYHNQISHEEK